VLAMTDNENDEVVRIEKEAAERRLFRKLQQRERLRRLSDTDARKTAAQREIEALKSYIDQWRLWMQRDGPGLELPHSAPFVEEGRTWAHSILDPLDTPNMWAIKIIDSSMNELAVLPGGMQMRHALKIRWLNEYLDCSVFRSSRISQDQVDDLADAGERALIPMVKRRGLPLE
jgi:hypothetical protein